MLDVTPIDQAVIAADTPLKQPWTQRKAGDWICQGASGAIYGSTGTSNHFFLVMPAPAPKAAACECGVKFTGGIHSDWCPRAGEAA
jgi:hypothetical protein